MTDIRDELREHDPELHDLVRRLWPEEERRRYARERLAASLKTYPLPADDRSARIAVQGVASVLLHHDVSGWLTTDLSQCWNSYHLSTPLPEKEVDALVAKASRAELARRKREVVDA